MELETRNSKLHPLIRLARSGPRTACGLMSGTSLDGVDAVVARFEGSGRSVQFEVLSHVQQPYDEALRALVLEQSAPETSSVKAISQLHVRLAHVYAEAVRAACETAGVAPGDLDLVGQHGQTVHHVPEAEACAGAPTRSTLQLGSAPTLAQLAGAPVVADFRAADVALGGQGAPLVPYTDWALFTSDDEGRGLLNLGGIANLTVLPRGAEIDDVTAFDTGPANMVMDALADRLLGVPYDADGAVAAHGHVKSSLLRALLADPYFDRPPPKSTGRERFGAPFVERVLYEGKARGVTAPEDLLATACALTAQSVADAVVRHGGRTEVVLVSGGGARNATLLRMLRDRIAPIPVRPIDRYGVTSEAKEALAFALLAHAWADARPTSLPAVTGAKRAALLGTLALPG